MPAEQIFERLSSDLAKSLQQLVKRLPSNWLHAPKPVTHAKFRQGLNRLYVELADQYVEVAGRAESKICEECSHYIHWWERRVAANEQAGVHRSCWEGRQFFSQLMSAHLPQSEQSHFIASREYKSHQIANIVGKATDLDQAAGLIESMVSSFHDEMQRSGKDSPQTEYARGLLGGAKAMLAELCGAATKEQVLRDARRRVWQNHYRARSPLPPTPEIGTDGIRTRIEVMVIVEYSANQPLAGSSRTQFLPVSPWLLTRNFTFSADRN